VLIGSTWFWGRQVERFPDDDGDRDLEQHALVRLKETQRKIFLEIVFIEFSDSEKK
jgi:hypothetical protein